MKQTARAPSDVLGVKEFRENKGAEETDRLEEGPDFLRENKEAERNPRPRRLMRGKRYITGMQRKPHSCFFGPAVSRPWP